jgi:hypothetical protein
MSVHQPQPRVPRRSAVDTAALDAFEGALEEAKAERIAVVEQRWA